MGGANQACLFTKCVLKCIYLSMVARSPVFLRSTNLESKLIEFFVFVKF